MRFSRLRLGAGPGHRELRSWGRGRVIIGDAGIRRVRLWGQTQLSWSEIRDYRILANPLSSGDWHTDDLVIKQIPREPQSNLRVRLLGDSKSLSFGWPFRDGSETAARVVERVAKPLVDDALSTFATQGMWKAGPISFAPHGLQWQGKESVASERVEGVELFETVPLRFRIMLRGKVLPYGSLNTQDLPNLLGVLAVARKMGLRIKGQAWLAPIVMT